MSHSYLSAFLCDALFSLPKRQRAHKMLAALAFQTDCSLDCHHESNFFRRRSIELYWEVYFRRTVPFLAIEKLLDGPEFEELELHVLEVNRSESCLELSMELVEIANYIESEIRTAAEKEKPAKINRSNAESGTTASTINKIE